MLLYICWYIYETMKHYKNTSIIYAWRKDKDGNENITYKVEISHTRLKLFNMLAVVFIYFFLYTMKQR